jgi:leader peptidase (prepilin peptidase)/N-methyltransferase
LCDFKFEKAGVARPPFFSHAAREVRRARQFRRLRVVGFQVLSALTWRRGARAQSPAAWAYVLGFLWLSGQSPQIGWYAIPGLVLFVSLGVAAAIDTRYLVLPDGSLIVLAACGAVMLMTISGDEAIGRILAALFAFAAFRGLGWAYEEWRGFPGLGQGDASLFAIAGLWLVWAVDPLTLA